MNDRLTDTERIKILAQALAHAIIWLEELTGDGGKFAVDVYKRAMNEAKPAVGGQDCGDLYGHSGPYFNGLCKGCLRERDRRLDPWRPCFPAAQFRTPRTFK